MPSPQESKLASHWFTKYSNEIGKIKHIAKIKLRTERDKTLGLPEVFFSQAAHLPVVTSRLIRSKFASNSSYASIIRSANCRGLNNPRAGVGEVGLVVGNVGKYLGKVGLVGKWGNF